MVRLGLHYKKSQSHSVGAFFIAVFLREIPVCVSLYSVLILFFNCNDLESNILLSTPAVETQETLTHRLFELLWFSKKSHHERNNLKHLVFELKVNTGGRFINREMQSRVDPNQQGCGLGCRLTHLLWILCAVWYSSYSETCIWEDFCKTEVHIYQISTVEIPRGRNFPIDE